MPDRPQPPRLLLLDLRSEKRSALPTLPGLTVVTPNPSGDCKESRNALGVLVAIDGEAAYADWVQRFHPMCPEGFPHVILLKPYDHAIARSALDSDAADCCAMDDGERLDLIIARLARKPRTTCMEAVSPARLAHLLRLQATVEGLSVAAISYYVIGLFGYLVKAVHDTQLVHVEPSYVTAAFMPIAIVTIWLIVRRIRRRHIAGEKD